jgi:hypothetical protein
MAASFQATRRLEGTEVHCPWGKPVRGLFWIVSSTQTLQRQKPAATRLGIIAEEVVLSA